MSVFFCVISSACIMRFSLCGILCRCGAHQTARSTINPPIAMYTMAYGIAAFKISPSRPCISQAAVAIAMLCGEIILPPVAPVVFAATSQSELL